MPSFQDREGGEEQELLSERIGLFRRPYQAFYLDFKVCHNEEIMKNYKARQNQEKNRNLSLFIVLYRLFRRQSGKRKPPERISLRTDFRRNLKEGILLNSLNLESEAWAHGRAEGNGLNQLTLMGF